MPWFQDKWEALSPKIRKILEVAFGLILAIASSFFLIRATSKESSTMSTLAAAGIALIIPRVLETQTGNKLSLMRIVLLVSLIFSLLIMVILAVRSGKMFN